MQVLVAPFGAHLENPRYTAALARTLTEKLSTGARPLWDTSVEFARAQSLVLNTARRLGLQITGLGTDYANFLASSKELIDAAKAAWREDRFPKVPGETERVPLP